LHKYRPETKRAKRKRLLAAAQAKTENKDAAPAETKKPNVVKYGLKHITGLVEQKKAKLVIIAHDVDPIEVIS
jgi:large subunit ribosomal protein L7Ae